MGLVTGFLWFFAVLFIAIVLVFGGLTTLFFFDEDEIDDYD